MALGKKKEKNVLPDAEKLRAMPVQELEKTLKDTRQQLMNARFQHAGASLEDTASLKNMRRQVARISTILNEKQENS